MRTFSDMTFKERSEIHGIDQQYVGRPHINVNHVDGPLLFFSDGQLHWLGLWERLMLWLGRTNASRLQRKLRPRLTAELDARGVHF